MKGLVEKARALAERAHKGHVRKSDGSPYYAHLQGVARLLEEVGATEEVVAAAYLHDSLEDAGLTPASIEEATSLKVALLVLDVSEDKSIPFAQRKALYISEMSKHGEESQLLALADKLEQLQALHRQLLPLDAAGRAEGWTCFKAGREGSLAFYRAVLGAAAAEGSPALHSLKEAYAAALAQVGAL